LCPPVGLNATAIPAPPGKLHVGRNATPEFIEALMIHLRPAPLVPAGELLQAALPGCAVYKAFNMVGAELMVSRWAAQADRR
jgi:hypothetical protein